MKKRNEKELVEGSLKLIAKSSIAVFISIFISKVASYVYRIMIARYYGPEVYGSFNLAVMVIGWIMVVATLGLSDGLMRYIAFYRGKKEYEKIRFTVRQGFMVLTLTSIISAAFLFVSADLIATHIFKNPGLKIFLQIFSFVMPASMIPAPFLASLRSFEKVGVYAVIANILQSMVKVFLLAGFMLLGFGSASVPISYLFGVIFMSIASYLACRYYTPKIFGTFELSGKEKKKIAKEILLYSMPLVFLGIFGSIFAWLDTFALGLFRTIEEVGIYNAAMPIAIMFLFVPEVLYQMFFPLIIKEYSMKNMSVVRESSKQVAKWIFILNLPALVIILLFPGAVLNILFGSQYLAASNSLRILSIGTFFASFAGVSTYLLSAIGKSKIVFYNFAFTSIFNLVLNFLLVQKYGMVGVATSTAASYFILGGLAMFQIKRQLGFIPLRRKMFSIALVSLIPSAILWFLDLQMKESNIIFLATLALFFFLVYITLVFLTNGFDKNDVLVLKSAMKKLKIPGRDYIFGKLE